MGDGIAEFKKDPTPILPILEILHADKSLYVRKSVANNLNDIAKDHPELVLDIATRWQGSGPESDWIIRHACRTLLKRSDSRALALFGFDAAHKAALSDFYCDQKVQLGKTLTFSATLKTSAQQLGKLRVEYHLHFLRARGDYGKKVFHWFEGEVVGSQKAFNKSLRFTQMTTRQYYPGTQKLLMVVNGQVLKQIEFELMDV